MFSQQWRLKVSGLRVQMQQGNITLCEILKSNLKIRNPEFIKLKRLKRIISLCNVKFDKQLVFVIESGTHALFIFR